MNSLLFLHDDLMRPSVHKEMKIPLEFVCFAYVEGKLYRQYNNRGSFIIHNGKTRVHGNSYVYGALFHVHDTSFYMRLIDSYYACSKSALLRNHALDTHHRIEINATPIRFSSLRELGRLKYTESELVVANCYVGNPDHPKVATRFSNTTSCKITEGIIKPAFAELYKEVAP